MTKEKIKQEHLARRLTPPVGRPLRQMFCRKTGEKIGYEVLEIDSIFYGADSKNKRRIKRKIQRNSKKTIYKPICSTKNIIKPKT